VTSGPWRPPPLHSSRTGCPDVACGDGGDGGGGAACARRFQTPWSIGPCGP